MNWWHRIWCGPELWTACVSGLATAIGLDGLGYTIWGYSISQTSSYSIINLFPGGMRLFGAVMIVICAVLIVAIMRCGVFAERALLATFVFATLVECEVVGGWIYSGSVGFSPVTKWFVIGWFALWLSVQRPSPRAAR